MSINTFYSLSLNERMDLLNRQGEYIGRISFYGYVVNLYICEHFYVEVYYNCQSQDISDIELLDPKDERLHQYAVPVNLSNLYQT